MSGPYGSLVQGLINTPAMSNGCGCIGPQRGAPLCPCQMAAYGVTVINGRYVQPARDLGPVPTAAEWVPFETAASPPKDQW